MLIQFFVTIEFRVFIDFFCFACETFAKFFRFLNQKFHLLSYLQFVFQNNY